MYQRYNERLNELYSRKMKLETAMELLDFESVDPLARRLAIWHLQTLSIAELKTFTVQLVQCIKFERSLTLIQYLI